MSMGKNRSMMVTTFFQISLQCCTR